MQRVHILMLAIFSVIAACGGQERNEATLTKELTRIAGQAATSCGLVTVAAEFSSAWACAQANDSTGKPFWLAIREAPVDSEVWQAIARNSSGERYTIFYTSNNNGQPSFEPYFKTQPCSQAFSYSQSAPRLFTCGERVP